MRGWWRGCGIRGEVHADERARCATERSCAGFTVAQTPPKVLQAFCRLLVSTVLRSTSRCAVRCRVRVRGGDAFHEPSGLVARGRVCLDDMGEFVDHHAEVIGVVGDPLRIEFHAIATSECWHLQPAAEHQDDFFGPRPLVGGKESSHDGVPLGAHFPGVPGPLHEGGGVGDVGHVEDDGGGGGVARGFGGERGGVAEVGVVHGAWAEGGRGHHREGEEGGGDDGAGVGHGGNECTAGI